MRATIQAILIAIVVSAAGAAAAQDMNRPAHTGAAPGSERLMTNGAAVLPEAPIGHRQPTLRDLPPSVRREENLDSTQGNAVNPSYGVPNICNGC